MAGVVYSGRVYPLRPGDIIDLSDRSYPKADCPGFVARGAAIPYALASSAERAVPGVGARPPAVAPTPARAAPHVPRRATLLDTVRRHLGDQPVHMAELLRQVHDSGWRRVDDATIWQLCSTHGLADLDGRMWVPRGAPSTSATQAGPAVWPARSSGPAPLRTGPAVLPLAPELRPEYDAVRAALDLPAPPAHAVPFPPPPGWADVVQDAAVALSDELAQVSRQRTETDLPLANGRRVATVEHRTLHRFDMESDGAVPEGSTQTLLVGGNTYEVEVVSIFGLAITLAAPLSMSDTEEAVLRCDLSWLLARQRQRLLELRDGGVGFNPAAALAAGTGRLAPQDGTPRSDVHVDATPGVRLNPGQQAAVLHARGGGLRWLWGPPGTGKTTTVARIIADQRASGRRLLLAAPTNVAVDVALMALLEALPARSPGEVVRVGQTAHPDLAGRRGDPVLVDEVAAVRGQPVAEAVVGVVDRVTQLRAQLTVLKRSRRTAAEESRRLFLESEIADLQALVKAYEALLREVRRAVCREAGVVAATCHQVLLDTLAEIEFDVVVLEEGSMVPASLAMLVAGAGRGHTIVAGDFRQLPPVVLATTAAADRWLRRSHFESTGVADDVSRGAIPASMVALVEQYRMQPLIAEAVSSAFYPESPLTTPRRVRERSPSRPLASASGPIHVVDTSALRAWTGRRGGAFSRYNLVHAQLVANLIHRCGPGSVGLVSPFAPQARLLEALRPSERGDVHAATVHRFQGGERDVIVFDSVDTGVGLTRRHRWFEDGQAGGDGARLLNVAASRARDSLVVVADLRHLHRERGKQDAVATLWTLLMETGALILPERLLADETAPTKAITGGVVTRLTRDISDTDASVDLWLPAVTPGAWPPLVGALAAAEAAGRQVTAWYAPAAGGSPPPGLTNDLLLTANLRPIRPLRESMAIVGDIVWTWTGALREGAGNALRTLHQDLAGTLRRLQSRRSTHAVPGSGERGDNCGYCHRPLVRLESGASSHATVRFECLTCSDSRISGLRSRARRRNP